MFFLIASAVVIAGGICALISMPSIPRKREYTIITPRSRRERRKHPRPNWQELGYTEYSAYYIW